MKKIFLFLSVILLSSLKAMADEPYALLSDNNTKLTFYYDVKPNYGLDVGPFKSIDERGWDNIRENITTVEFHISMTDCSTITSTAYWFDGLTNLNTIARLEYLQTENVTDMRYMFRNCKSLTSLDLSGFDTGNVTDMSFMFDECSRLTSLDVSGFNTGNVTNLMCMFDECSRLTSLDLTNFNTENVTQMGQMFYQCTNLQTIYCNDTWNSTTPSQAMFTGCTSLVGGTGTTYNSQNVDAAYAHPNEGGYFTGNAEPYALLSDNNTKLTFYYGVKPDDGMSVGPFTPSMWCGWVSAAATITTVEFHSSMANCNSVTSTAYWFEGLEKLTTITGIKNLNTANVTDMRYMFRNCKSLTSLDLSGFDTGNVTDMSWMFYYCSSLTSLDLSGFDTGNVTDMNYMFYNCSSLTSLDVSGFDTGNVTDMRYMFSYCEELTSLDVSGFKTGKVTNMRNMFCDCSSLTSLDVSKFDTGKVTNMADMFSGCSGLTSLDVSKFDTGKVTNMAGMFYYCSSLTSLDVSKFDTGNVTDMTYMFRMCTSLTSLDVSGFDTGSVKEMYDMFSNCSNLTSLDVSGFKTGNVWSMSRMFYNCSGLTSLDVSGFDTGSVTNMYEMFCGCSGLTSLDVSGFDTGNVTNMEAMFYGCSSLTSLDVRGFDTGNVTKMSYMFYNCSSLKTIYCDDTWNQNTSSQNMFYGCTSLVGGTGTHYSADNVTAAYAHPNEGGYFTGNAEPYALLSDNNTKLTFYYGVKPDDGMGVGPFTAASDRGWNSAATTITTVEFDASMADCNTITSTAYWFYNLENLTTITDIENLNTTNVTNMLRMFSGCKNMESLDLSSFDTSNVIDMSYMFYFCSGLTSLDVSGFDTGSVTNMNWMFCYCSGLTSLDVSGFDTGKVTNMGSMFSSCSRLTSLDLSRFNTSRVVNMSSMFYGCSGLTSLDLSRFNTSRVVNMSSMFYYCSGLTSLDLTSFKTSNVSDMSYMFKNCSKLETIYCFDTWDKNTKSPEMFRYCSSLVGDDGTHYSPSCVDAAYAHPNEGGYFTRKPEPYALLSGSSNDRTLTFYYGVKPTGGMDVGPFNRVTARQWDDMAATITTVVFDETMANCKSITSTAYWFSKFYKLNSIVGLENLKTENVEDMKYMFSECSLSSSSTFESLDLRTFDTRNVKDFHGMFSSSSRFSSIDLSSFDTGNATDMYQMFYQCGSLTSLDLTNFNTENVTQMGQMFYQCSSLTSLDLTNFNTENVTQMGQMFYHCTNLQTIYCNDTWKANTSSRNMFTGCTSLVGGTGTTYNAANSTAAYAHPNEGGYFTMKREPFALLGGSGNNKTLTFYYAVKSDYGLDVVPFESAGERGWNDERENITTVVFHSTMDACSTITSTAHWFAGLTNLTTIENLEYLHTEDVTDMSYMFNGCSSLTSIDISSFDTEKVANMEGMFWGCTGLTELDLVNFNTAAVTNMIGMFYNCSKLKTIYCNDTWNSTTSSQAMFYGCTSLVGGTGTTYSSSHITAAYAHPNAGGYFTKGLLGDVNSDGKVTPADAIMILYHYFGVAQTGFNESVADVNGDKKISPADAIEALYIYFGSSSGGNARATRPATVSCREPE